ncbi:hypothetical protein FRC08_001467 [Ceratobasidium sp. 394]|nr:hypothetical protein FRC08_001467 [Ceratobasidium sp. 394]KAG9094513.1 hypothetical protein FS749_012313 [Ceratobasidium sp. UAMH 11750]
MSTSPSEVFATPSNMKLVPYTRPTSEFRVSPARAAATSATHVLTNPGNGYVHVPPKDRAVRVAVKNGKPMSCIKMTFIFFVWFMVIGFCVTHPQSFDILFRTSVAIVVILVQTVGIIVQIIISCFHEIGGLAKWQIA